MAYRITAIPMTLSDLQGHYLLQAFSNVIFFRTAMFVCDSKVSC